MMGRLSPRSPWDTLHCACRTKYLPLTLSLLPSRRAKAPLRRDGGREREQQAPDWCLAEGRRAISGAEVIERRWTILPLLSVIYAIKTWNPDQTQRRREL